MQKIKRVKPLIHNITNYVVMEKTANLLLALGASPIMSHATEEVAEITSSANALALNIGTLSSFSAGAMKLSIKKAQEKKIPIILDPVGAGASHYRTTVSLELIREGVTLIRANASEVLALTGGETKIKGVDALIDADLCIENAKGLAKREGCVVLMSGKTDTITDGSFVVQVSGGDPLMQCVTGMGCTLSAAVAAFLSVEKDALKAAERAAYLFKWAGEKAASKARGPGYFYMEFIDSIYDLFNTKTGHLDAVAR